MTGLAIRLGGDVSGLDKAMQRGADIVSTRGKQMVATALKTGQAMDQAFSAYKTIQLAAQHSTALTTGLRGAAVALGAVALGIGIVKSLEAATRAAADQVERIAKIGEGARDTGVSTTFYQVWTGQARSLKVQNDDLIKSLERLKEASTIKLGEGSRDDVRNQSALEARLRKQVEAGNLDTAGLNRFLAAGDNEQRLRVLLDLMRELQQQRKDLAAIDIGSQFLSPALVEGIRNGSIELDRLKQRLNDVKSADVQIFEAADIENAREMQRRLEEAYRIISNDLKPIYQDFASAGRDFYGSTVSWVEALAGGVRLLAQAYSLMKSAGGIADSVAKSIGNSGVANSLNDRLKQAFPDSYNDNNQTPIARQLREADAGKAAIGTLAERLGAGPQGEKALADLARRMNRTAVANDMAKSRQMSDGLFADKSKPIITGGGSSKPAASSGGADKSSSLDRYVQTLERARDVAKAEAETAGLGNIAKEKAVALVRAQSAAQRDVEAGLRSSASLTDVERSKIASAAEATAKWREEAEQVRETLDFAKGLMGDALKGFLGDLREGKSLGEALGNVMNRISTKILDKLVDLAVGGLLGGSTGGFGFLGKLFGFSAGGFTGEGGKYEPAGVVHRGEYVLSKEATSRIGVSNLDALHNGALKGFASGGLVGAAPIAAPAIPSAGGFSNMNAVNQNVVVNVTGGSTGDPKKDAAFADQIGRQVQHSLRAMIGQEMKQAMRPGGLLKDGLR
jgi:hypothetical protein